MKRLLLASLVLALSVTAMPGNGETVTNSRVALGQTIKELNVESVSLGKTIDYLRDSTGANIVVNWKILEGVGVAKDTPVTMQVRNLPLRKMLQLVLDQVSPNAQLVYSVDGNVIEITSQEEADKQMITKVYVVDDLVMQPWNRVAPTLSLGTTTTSGTGGGGGGFGGGMGQGGSGGGLFPGSNNNSNTQTSDQIAQNAAQRGNDLVTLIRDVIRPNIWHENGGPASIRYFSGKLIVTAPLSVHEALGGPVGTSGVRYGS